jgi:hypothetical protein
MPRPDNVTDKDMARWEAEQQEYEQEHGSPPLSLLNQIVPQGFSPPSHKEVWCAGCWLSRELKKLGATDQEIEEMGFANGQHLLFSTDVWQTSSKSLEDFKRGEWDKPGAELAEKLAMEHLPRIIDNSRSRN